MQVEFRLKCILKGKGRMTHRCYTKLAEELGVNWRTVKGMCENTLKSISLAQIATICYRLEQMGMGEGLPGALFGYRPSCLLKALGEPGLVTIYMGEYQLAEDPATSPWLSRDDSAAGAAIVELLSKAGCAEGGVRFNHVFVPFHFSRSEECVRQHLARDAAVARDCFEQLRQAEGSFVIIGSPTANYMCEDFVADISGCTPFEPATGRPPFYMRYRTAKAPSCFGGAGLPPGCGEDGGPGIYVRKDGRWEVRPSNETRDCGMVVLRRDPGEGRVEKAVFGYRGRATALLGDMLREEPDAFWKPAEEGRSGCEKRAYLVSFELKRIAGTWKTGPTHRVVSRIVEEIPLDHQEGQSLGMDTGTGP